MLHVLNKTNPIVSSLFNSHELKVVIHDDIEIVFLQTVYVTPHQNDRNLINFCDYCLVYEIMHVIGNNYQQIITKLSIKHSNSYENTLWKMTLISKKNYLIKLLHTLLTSFCEWFPNIDLWTAGDTVTHSQTNVHNGSLVKQTIGGECERNASQCGIPVANRETVESDG